MSFFCNPVGRKIVMAVTGLCLTIFLVVHLLGNLSLFAGPNGINAYAEKLQSLGPIVWIFRAVIALLVGLHVFFGVTLTLENVAANPEKYAVSKKLKTTFASETMIWTGAGVGLFLAYHLAHFTARVTPGIVKDVDIAGRFDVFRMVTADFAKAGIAGVYVVAMVALFLHLSHGVQSLFQTLGVADDKSLPKFAFGGTALSRLFLLGYASIPLVILFGLLAR